MSHRLPFADIARRVEGGISLLTTEPYLRTGGFRRRVTSDEIARESRMPVADVNLVGRRKERIYFDVVDRQFRATYEGGGRWRINHRARFW